MSIAEKLTTVAENQEKVYKAGQSSMVDESKIIEKTVTGTNVVVINDTSEIPHDVGCKVESVNLYHTDYIGGSSKGITVKRNADGSFSVSGTAAVEVYIHLGHRSVDEGFTYYCSGGTPNVSLSYQLSDGIINNFNTITSKGGIVSTDGNLHGYTLKSINCVIVVKNGETVNEIVKPMVSLTETSDYTPYVDVSNIAVMRYGESAADNLETYTANADGTVDGIKSLCPVMTLSTDVEGVELTVNYHKSWGKQAAYDAVWEGYQQGGNRTDYSNAFRGGRFTDETFRPKYDIRPTKSDYMFAYQGYDYEVCITDLAARLEEAGVVLDTSKCTDFSYMFYVANKITHIPAISLESASGTIDALFTHANALETIDCLIFKEDGSNVLRPDSWGAPFQNCFALKNITIRGKIGCTISFAQSPLTKASIIDIFEHLSTTTTGKTVTFKASALTTAFGELTSSQEWLALVDSRPNWTISLA